MKLALTLLLALPACAGPVSVHGRSAPASKPAHRAKASPRKNTRPLPSRAVLSRPARRADRSEQRTSLLTVTAYCSTGNHNAAGQWPTIGTAAANAYPLGTRLHVEGVGVVTVEDRSAPNATDVDLYLGSGPECEAAATRFGRQTLRVEVAA